MSSLVQQNPPYSEGRSDDASRYYDGQFHNWKTSEKKTNIGWKILYRSLFGQHPHRVPHSAIPVQALTRTDLDALEQDAAVVYRFGHSTLLLKLDGHFWLTDPVFSERASPVSFAGPKRFHKPPMEIDDLPPIKAVILSHDHYDHLDKQSILKLKEKTEFFVTPLGVGAELQKWGVSSSSIIERDWWQSCTIEKTTFVATPSQHFSGRGLSDKNSTLWASWVIKGAEKNLFFSGDGGYFPGFKLIGDRYGPFDLTFVETGAYNELWPDVHMTPEQSLQAHLDLKGKVMMPIHNGTFNLSFHTWTDPFERISKAASEHKVNLQTPIVGQALNLKEMEQTTAWWQGLE